ncbi:hypothetical protein NG895_02175 [Aeoliella sp. ICT_H6.2]|uniref:Uncharacterized protein n=1 Tax=Aeoliella straminimaris TaxID=2954799 RepID=A0A9X2JFS2_9BACT|nr:hypothetical protein [Aeoliella straminimaris]MCO6042703.1 hypothetical protein [Aeoliella straminimaris]
MSNLGRFGDDVWDRFFDEVTPSVEIMTPTEVDSELKKRGIDVTNAVARVHRAVASAKARAQLEQARNARPGIVKKLSGLVAPPVGSLRQTVNDLIAGRLHGSLQGAYFRKLEQAADENDLRALMEDIERLEALTEDNDADSQT